MDVFDRMMVGWMFRCALADWLMRVSVHGEERHIPINHIFTTPWHRLRWTFWTKEIYKQLSAHYFEYHECKKHPKKRKTSKESLGNKRSRKDWVEILVPLPMLLERNGFSHFEISPKQNLLTFKSKQGVGSLCFITFTWQSLLNGLTFHTFDTLEESQHDCTLHLAYMRSFWELRQVSVFRNYSSVVFSNQ